MTFAAIVGAALMSLMQPEAGRAVDLYVATTGSDDHPGTKERPFRSLERARDALRKLRKEGPLTGPATIWIRGGVYHRSQTFSLKEKDGGTEQAPVVYRAPEGETVSVVGGRELPASWCEPVRDPAILARMDEAARGRTLQVSLKAHGIEDYGEMSISGPMMGLFCRGETMPLSRWPNEGYAPIGQVVQVDKDSVPRLVDGSKQGRTFRYSGDRPKRWIGAEDAVLHGLWWYGWLDEHVQIERIDPVKQEITLVTTPGGGIRKGQWFCALNLLEEIDRPGEWYLDRRKGILYFLPLAGFKARPVFLSMLKEPLVTLENTSHVTVRGLTLEVTRGVGVVIAGGKRNLLAGCTIRSIGSHGVILDHGTENGVLGCDIHDTGSTAIRVTGGNRSTLQPAENFVVNCHIHHFARRKKVYEPAVRLYGVGHRVAHNLIHDAPHQAIAYDGNDHLVEFNEIHHVVLESSDAGVLYTGRDWTFRGNKVRHNFFHHIPFRPGFGAKVVYMDDCASSTEVFGNVFYKTRESVFIGGGRDNVVENNVFIECEKPVHIDDRGLTWDYFRPEGPMYESLRRVKYNEPPWSTRYPELARILEEHPQAPLGNTLVRNVSYKSTWGKSDERYFTISDNLVTDDDPGFVDAARMDFRLREDSVVYRKIPGFRRIPFEKIGLYRDEVRTHLPRSRDRP